MKRIIALLLTALMVLGMFAFAEGDGTTLPTSVVQEQGPDRIVDEPTSFTLWCGSQTDNIDDYDNDLCTRWYEEKTGVHVDFTVVPSETSADRFNTMIASKNYPDLATCYMSVDQVNELGGPEGILMPLDDLIEEGWMPNFEKYISEHPDLECLRMSDGKFYAFPSASKAPWMIYTRKIFVKTAWLEQYLDDGGDYPDVWNAFEDMLQYFKDNDMNGNGDPDDEIPLTGLQPSGWGTDPTNTLLCTFGPALGQGNSQFLYVDDNGETVWAAGEDWYRDALRWLHHLVEEGLYDTSMYTMTSGTYRSLVADDLVGVAGGATPGQFTDFSMEGDWTALPAPEGPNGYHGVPVNSTEYDTMSFCGAIFKTCSNPEVVAKWIDYFFTEEGATVAAMGFKDINFYESNTMSIDGDPTSLVAIHGEDEVYNSWWGNWVAPHAAVDGKYSAEEGNNALYVEHAKIYEQYYDYTGIPLVGVPLSAAEEARLAECFNHVVLQSYYYSFDYVCGTRDVEKDTSWEKFKAYINTDGMLDDYIRLINKKYRGINE